MQFEISPGPKSAKFVRDKSVSDRLVLVSTDTGEHVVVPPGCVSSLVHIAGFARNKPDRVTLFFNRKVSIGTENVRALSLFMELHNVPILRHQDLAISSSQSTKSESVTSGDSKRQKGLDGSSTVPTKEAAKQRRSFRFQNSQQIFTVVGKRLCGMYNGAKQHTLTLLSDALESILIKPPAGPVDRDDPLRMQLTDDKKCLVTIKDSAINKFTKLLHTEQIRLFVIVVPKTLQDEDEDDEEHTAETLKTSTYNVARSTVKVVNNYFVYIVCERHTPKADGTRMMKIPFKLCRAKDAELMAKLAETLCLPFIMTDSTRAEVDRKVDFEAFANVGTMAGEDGEDSQKRFEIIVDENGFIDNIEARGLHVVEPDEGSDEYSEFEEYSDDDEYDVVTAAVVYLKSIGERKLAKIVADRCETCGEVEDMLKSAGLQRRMKVIIAEARGEIISDDEEATDDNE